MVASIPNNSVNNLIQSLVAAGPAARVGALNVAASTSALAMAPKFVSTILRAAGAPRPRAFPGARLEIYGSVPGSGGLYQPSNVSRGRTPAQIFYSQFLGFRRAYVAAYKDMRKAGNEYNQALVKHEQNLHDVLARDVGALKKLQKRYPQAHGLVKGYGQEMNKASKAQIDRQAAVKDAQAAGADVRRVQAEIEVDQLIAKGQAKRSERDALVKKHAAAMKPFDLMLSAADIGKSVASGNFFGAAKSTVKLFLDTFGKDTSAKTIAIDAEIKHIGELRKKATSRAQKNELDAAKKRLESAKLKITSASKAYANAVDAATDKIDQLAGLEIAYGKGAPNIFRSIKASHQDLLVKGRALANANEQYARALRHLPDLEYFRDKIAYDLKMSQGYTVNQQDPNVRKFQSNARAWLAHLDNMIKWRDGEQKKVGNIHRGLANGVHLEMTGRAMYIVDSHLGGTPIDDSNHVNPW
jgi:hypothetical protein